MIIREAVFCMYYYSNRKKRAKRLSFSIFCIILSFSIAFAVLFETVVYPSVCDYIESILQTRILNLMNDAVEDVLSISNVAYDDIVIVDINEDNKVSTLQIDSIVLNTIKAKIANATSDLADGTEDIEVRIPLGTILGSSAFAGTGPNIPFAVKTTSSVFTYYKSDFSDPGINQTLHKIIINIRCISTFVLPLHRKSFTTESDYIMAQSVIVGDVPENYTVVIENGDAIEDTVGNIFDYGTGG